MLNIVIGSHVWVADKDLAWIDGEVFKIDGQNAHVRTTKGKTVCVHDFCCIPVTFGLSWTSDKECILNFNLLCVSLTINL